MTSEKKQLDDFLPTYRSLQEPHPQSYIASKKEFADLREEPKERPPLERGEYYSGQELFSRIMMLTDRMFMFWEPGVGKTCGFTAYGERVKKISESISYMMKTYFQSSSRIKKCIILVKGETLVKEFRTQIVRVCTPKGEYDTPSVMAAKGIAKESAITKELNKWYEITTYGVFASKLKQLREERGGDTALIEEYEDCIFFVDEIHNLRIGCVSGKSSDEEDIVEDESLIRDILKSKKETKRSYRQLDYLFHLLQRCKVILASGSPMINDPCELGPLMNLILPMSMRFPRDFNFETATADDVEPYFRGRISYIRQLDTGIDIHLNGENLQYDGQNFNTIVYKSMMQPFQDTVYSRILGNEREGGARSVWAGPRKASNIVYPNGMTGNVGYNHYIGSYEALLKAKNVRVIPNRRGRRAKKVSPRVESREERVAREEKEVELRERYLAFMQVLSNVDEVRKFATKYATIADLEKNVLRNSRQPGNSFVFCDFVGIGAEQIAKIFEAAGFEEFNETTSVFETPSQSVLAKSPTFRNGRQEERALRVGFVKKPRYALLTPEEGRRDRVFRSMMDAFNSYENRHGELIQIFIGSPVARDGINLMNVVRIHPVSPTWTPSGDFQAKSRGIRSASHDDLLYEKRVEYELNNRDPKTARVRVEIYNHVAISAMSSLSIDLLMYATSEIKKRSILRVENLMKIHSVDCLLNLSRNIRPSDIEPPHICYDTTPVILGGDTSTSDILYANADVTTIIPAIKTIFEVETVMSIKSLKAQLQGREIKTSAFFISIALQQLIDTHEILRDRFGFPIYLNSDGVMVYTTYDRPLSTNKAQYDLHFYRSNLIGNITLTLQEYLEDKSLDENAGIVNYLQQNIDKLDYVLDSLPMNRKIDVIERILIDPSTNAELLQKLLEKYKHAIFQFREPVNAIVEVSKRLRQMNLNRKKGRFIELEGRKATQIAEDAISTISETGVVVLVHNLWNRHVDRQKFNLFGKVKMAGRLRMWKQGESQWRDPLFYEEPVYMSLVQLRINTVFKPLEEREVYGIEIGLNIAGEYETFFGIVNFLNSKEHLVQDARLKAKGKELHSWKMFELYDLLMYLNIKWPSTPYVLRDGNVITAPTLHIPRIGSKLDRNTIRIELEAGAKRLE